MWQSWHCTPFAANGLFFHSEYVVFTPRPRWFTASWQVPHSSLLVWSSE